MGFSDRAEIEAIVAATAPNYGMRDLLLRSLQSKIFTHK